MSSQNVDTLNTGAILAPVADEAARERFRTEWRRSFAVSANAGSGKTTAISERLAAMALDPEGAAELGRTAVVTYTLKAAEEIGTRARERLLRRLEERGAQADLAALEQLERVFFGTLHSFCLKLAREHGHEAGLDLAPEVLDARGAEAAWEEFISGDDLKVESLAPEAVRWLFRLVRLEDVLEQACKLEPGEAEALRARAPRGLPPRVGEAGLAEILALAEKGAGAKNVRKTKERAQAWAARAEAADGREFLGLFQPSGTAAPVKAAVRAWMTPLAAWAAQAAGAVAGELALRFATWRRTAGVQTFADQVAAARELLHHPRTLAAARAAGWRVILDEAQDTDEAQFSILAELTRPAAAKPGTWPGEGAPPLPGRFCLVGDGQQSIYSSRASVRTFLRYLEAFDGGLAGDRLNFEVTFRAPHAVVELLNATLPAAFAPEREHNRGLPPEDGAEPPRLQVAYQPLVAGPGNAPGVVARLPLVAVGGAGAREKKNTFREEMRQIAAWLAARGPGGLGLAGWGDLCVLMARNTWMDEAVQALEAAGLKVARQSKQQQLGDQPAYGWVTGLATVCCAPDDGYEWFGVLREIFGVSDALLAKEKLRRGRFEWESPEVHAEPLRSALEALRPWVQAVDDEAGQLDRWCEGLVAAAGLEAKARAADASGATWRELERLRAEARAGAAEGLSPRAWTEALVAGRHGSRAENRSEPDAITVQTCHSAKGLEWTAVLVPGLWREISFDNGHGLQVRREADGTPMVYLKSEDVPDDTQISRKRERRRELVRLLYVTLTRPRKLLLLPWDNAMTEPHEQSFAALWGHELARLPEWQTPFAQEPAGATVAGATAATAEPGSEPCELIPRETWTGAEDLAESARWTRRLLPHELAQHGEGGAVDASRAARHEASAEALTSPRPGDDPIAYGLWWHETLEFVPWLGSDAEIAAHGEARLQVAERLGAGARARAEWGLLLQSEAWRELRSPRWSRMAELAVLAPLGAAGWMDGVMDLVLHDARRREVWVLDWKTNRLRAGESAEKLLERLALEYVPQLTAYGQSLALMFPGTNLKRLLYATGVGRWIEVGSHASG